MKNYFFTSSLVAFDYIFAPIFDKSFSLIIDWIIFSTVIVSTCFSYIYLISDSIFDILSSIFCADIMMLFSIDVKHVCFTSLIFVSSNVW